MSIVNKRLTLVDLCYRISLLPHLWGQAGTGLLFDGNDTKSNDNFLTSNAIITSWYSKTLVNKSIEIKSMCFFLISE